MNRRSWLLVAGLASLLVATVLISSPGGPTQSGPDGTLAFRRFVAEMGFEVSDADEPPEPPGTFVLLHDLRREEDAQRVAGWVARGGRLVLADPESLLAEELGIERAGPGRGLFGPQTLSPRCTTPESSGVRTIAVRISDPLLAIADPAAIPCFGDATGAFVIRVPRGRGIVVVLGGRSPLTNELLDEADNALFAYRIVSSGGPVVFGPPIPAASLSARPCEGAWDCLPDPAKAGVLQIVAAAIVFALVRARRLGNPVEEPSPSPIPASELIRATAALYRTAGARDHAAGTLRYATIRRLVRRFGLQSARPEELPALLARASDVPEDDLRHVLNGPVPQDDRDLIALGRDLERMTDRLEGGKR